MRERSSDVFRAVFHFRVYGSRCWWPINDTAAVGSVKLSKK